MTTIPVIDMALTGRNIVKLRTDRGLSVSRLLQILGLASPQAIYKWQRGMALPTIDNLVVLAAVFGVTTDEIIVTKAADGRISA